MPTEREVLEKARLTPASQRLLETISFAEGTRRPNPADAYRVMFGGGLASNLEKHPDTVIRRGKHASAAAGKYQFLPATYESQIKPLGYSGFSPEVQDIAALRLARQKLLPYGGLAALEKEGLSPRIAAALAPVWASFPTEAGTSAYGQPVKSLSELQKFYQTVNVGTSSRQPEAKKPEISQNGMTVEIEPFDFEDRLKNTLVSQAVKPALQGTASGASLQTAQLLSQATDLEASSDPEAQALGARLKSQALSQFTSSAGGSLNPAGIISNILQLKGEEQDYYQRSARVQKTLQDLQAQQIGQKVLRNAETGPKDGQWAPAATKDFYHHMQTSSPSLDPNQPGFDFTIEGGKRGAVFKSPYQAEVLKVVRGQNWETNLEKNPKGPRGYGNYVELRFTDPKTNRQVDSLIAHFDDVNPNLKPGAQISAGTPLGTQGRTGSTTGPHISWDVYAPGKNTAEGVETYIKQFRDRIASGLPIFG